VLQAGSVLTDRAGGGVPVPHIGIERERNGVDELCRERSALGYVTPTDKLTGLGVPIMARCDRQLRAVGDGRAMASRAVPGGRMKGRVAGN
jgi:hypothetical protein